MFLHRKCHEESVRNFTKNTIKIIVLICMIWKYCWTFWSLWLDARNGYRWCESDCDSRRCVWCLLLQPNRLISFLFPASDHRYARYALNIRIFTCIILWNTTEKSQVSFQLIQQTDRIDFLPMRDNWSDRHDLPFNFPYENSSIGV